MRAFTFAERKVNLSNLLDFCKSNDIINLKSENLEMSERYEKMEDAVDALEDALGDIDSAKENIENAAQ